MEREDLNRNFILKSSYSPTINGLKIKIFQIRKLVLLFFNIPITQKILSLED